MKQALNLFRWIGKIPAFDWFHYRNEFSMRSRSFIIGTGCDFRVFPICIVDLQLDDVDLRMRRQNLIEQIRSFIDIQKFEAL